MNVKFHKIASQKFTCVFTILVKFDIHFLGLPWEIFFGVIKDDYLHHVMFATLIVRVTLISRFVLYREIREINVSRKLHVIST